MEQSMALKVIIYEFMMSEYLVGVLSFAYQDFNDVGDYNS